MAGERHSRMSQIVELQPVPKTQPSPEVDQALKRVFAEAKTIADTFRILDEEILRWDERQEACIAGFPADKQKIVREVFAEVNAGMRAVARACSRSALRAQHPLPPIQRLGFHFSLLAAGQPLRHFH